MFLWGVPGPVQPVEEKDSSLLGQFVDLLPNYKAEETMSSLTKRSSILNNYNQNLFFNSECNQ